MAATGKSFSGVADRNDAASEHNEPFNVSGRWVLS